jgi:hypothetical protein
MVAIANMDYLDVPTYFCLTVYKLCQQLNMRIVVKIRRAFD